MKTDEELIENLTKLTLECTTLDEETARIFAQGCLEAARELARLINEA